MKPINRKGALNVLAIVEAIVLIPLFALSGMGKMSNAAFITTLFTILFLTVAAVVFILYKFPVTTTEKKDKFDPDLIKVGRTRGRTIIEILTGIIVVVAWIIALATRCFIGEDGGILYRNIFEMIFLTLFILFFTFGIFEPSDYYLAGKLTNVKQVSLAMLMYRVLALFGAFLLLADVIPALHKNWVILCWIAVVIISNIVFRTLIHRAKQAK